MRVFDLSAGGRILQSLHAHNKTVLSLSLDQGESGYLLSAGLDRRVNVFRSV